MLDVKSQDTIVTRIARRTRGQSHGPITRLMSPSDFGRLLKPFVFLDLIDNQGKPFSGFGLHPHSGIATLTYVAKGSVRYERTERRDCCALAVSNGCGPAAESGMEVALANGDGRVASSFGSPCHPSLSWGHPRASTWHQRSFRKTGQRVSSSVATEPRQVRSKLLHR